jgi:hypothetical protein
MNRATAAAVMPCWRAICGTQGTIPCQELAEKQRATCKVLVIHHILVEHSSQATSEDPWSGACRTCATKLLSRGVQGAAGRPCVSRLSASDLRDADYCDPMQKPPSCCCRATATAHLLQQSSAVFPGRCWQSSVQRLLPCWRVCIASRTSSCTQDTPMSRPLRNSTRRCLWSR